MEGYRALILDAVFPRRCVSCGTYGSWCCERCHARIEIVRTDPRDEALDGLVVAGFYHDPILRELIHGVKYDGATECADAFVPVLQRLRRERGNPWPWAGETALAIQPVIGSEVRVRERGFDQAVLIADLVRSELLPWASATDLLARRSAQSSQAELEPGPLRHANVHGVFHVRSDMRDLPASVLLIDDVYTTGATMHDAARALREAGVARVYGFALAMGR